MASTTVTKFTHLKIPLEDILKATNNFHHDNIIGRGDFGPAYKGQLLHSGELIKITARRLDRKHGLGDVEFWTEISALSDLKHTNIVSIIGYCDEKDVKIIITTYESNGSLGAYLNSSNLTWTQRLRISVGVARALCYLHHDKGRDYGFIHNNINSYTILLDENWEPKLSCFEISIKQAVNQMDQSILSNPIGTVGYTDPTIEMTGFVTGKSDIYSFGVVLFEILCGREAFIQKDAGYSFLASLAKYHYENQTLHEIIQQDLRNQMSGNQISTASLKIYSKIAYSCLEEELAHRPHMLNIVDELEKVLEKALKFRPRPENFGKNLQNLKIRLDDIKLATHNFSDTYKSGVTDHCTRYTTECDHFYKGNPSNVEEKSKSKLSNKHNSVDIKRFLLTDDDEYDEELFFTELEILSSVKHDNIITLIGFCVEGFEMILVMEKPSNGDLCDYLGNVKNMRTLNWEKRLKICIDVADILHYLHSEIEDQKIIIHSNICSFNIGLDENWRVKIFDFEFAVFLPPNQNHEAWCKRTYFQSKHHVDPEYANTGKLKRESDVYSFGVVLFEILCGRPADSLIYVAESEKGLVPEVRQNYGKTEYMIDPTLKEETSKKSSISNRGPNKDSLHTFLKIANRCVAKTQDQRPMMKVVLNELEKALVFQVSQEERIQQQEKDQIVDELEKATHEIPVKKFEHLKIPLTDIQSATNDFSKTYQVAWINGISLYRAKLNHYDKENPSSKRYNVVFIKCYPSERQYEFSTEFKVLSSGVKHPNIVTLLGFCVEASQLILVIDNFTNEFLFNTLENFNNKRILTWEKRLKICIDVANALEYIHSEMEDDQNVIINRDIWCYNIGLDENWRAKIVHFWWSVILSPNEENDALYPKNNIGRTPYWDPEYKKTGKLKRESDIYGFGVVLFEILCGRRAFDPIYMKESDIGLAPVARRSFSTGTLEDMIDPIIMEVTGENNFALHRGPNKDSLHIFMKIAYQCVSDTQDQRPTMKFVVKELEKALFFQANNKDNPKISLEDIKLATQNFHNDNDIGGGGFGKVYKGNLQYGDGFKTIVAKRLDTRLGQGEQQFLSELQILLEYKHKNVIGLVGYCDEANEKIIVNEYAPKGSLDRYLNDVSLTWVERLNISIDVATALYFFHGGFGKQAKVIHRDIKSANILLDHDWKAKLADFGLSLISPLTHETDFVIDHACGTPGYLDPVYRKSGFLTTESDIYSFGVVLFELLCGRSTFIIYKHEGYYLPDFIKSKFKEGKRDEVVFEKIREHIEPKSLTTFQKIAYQCLHHEIHERPTTKEVLIQLKKALAFQNMTSTMSKFATLRIPLEDILKATNNFHDDNILGHGIFYTMYKGQLMQSGKLTKIAARRFDCKHGEGELEFLTEISMLSDLKHTNIVCIIGLCDDIDDKIIVTKYEANGSLGQYLNTPNLTWTQRLRICVGVARALSYLHYDVGHDCAILHCNINSDTILLDENWEAKLSGFEHSIKQSIYNKDEVCLCEHTGTIGYMDPTIEKTGGMNHKSDIYAFGVVLFEILCETKAVIQNKAYRFLAPFARHHYENGTLQDIIHPNLLNQMSMQSFFKYSKAAYSCLEEERSDRPNMKNIVRTLEKALESHLRHGDNWKNLADLKIPLSHIQSATDDFSDKYKIESVDELSLYRVELDHYDKENHSSKRHSTVLIKRYPFESKSYGEEEFFTELEMLSSVKHSNVVTLRGYCIEASEMILVIDDFSNGFLGQCLRNVNNKRILTWEKRLRICIDIAHALEYIHSKMEDQKMMINRDIHCYNIGLGENWRAKIVHFWWSILLPPNQGDKALYLNWVGRLRYGDPEYLKTCKLKRESDVYGFGVVLFEILCGRTSYDPIYHKESDQAPTNVARQSFCIGTPEDMIDPILLEETGENDFVLSRGPNWNSLHTFINIAFQCVTETQDQRPSMKVVVEELEKALLFQIDGRTTKNKKKGNRGFMVGKKTVQVIIMPPAKVKAAAKAYLDFCIASFTKQQGIKPGS